MVVIALAESRQLQGKTPAIADHEARQLMRSAALTSARGRIESSGKDSTQRRPVVSIWRRSFLAVGRGAHLLVLQALSEGRAF
jgi:hypothetical protein